MSPAPRRMKLAARLTTCYVLALANCSRASCPVSVKDFNAVSDLIESQHQQFAAACSAAVASGCNEVYVPTGTYYFDGQVHNYHWRDGYRGIDLPSNFRLTLAPGAVLKAMHQLTDAGIDTARFGYTLLRVYGAHDVAIHGGTLVGERDQHWPYDTEENCTGLDIRGSHRVLVEDLTSVHHWGYGLSVHKCGSTHSYAGPQPQCPEGGDSLSHTITLRRCVFDDNRAMGCVITEGRDLTLSGCTFSRTLAPSPPAGVSYVPPSMGLRLESAAADTITGWGTYLTQSAIDNARVSGCTFLDNATGLDVSTDGGFLNPPADFDRRLRGTTHHVVVENNTFRDNGAHGHTWLAASEHRVGLRFWAYTTGCVARGNQITRSGREGIFALETSDLLLADNSITAAGVDSPAAGTTILLGEKVHRCTVQSNLCRPLEGTTAAQRTAYGIRVLAQDSLNYVVNNDLAGTWGATAFADAGTSTVTSSAYYEWPQVVTVQPPPGCGAGAVVTWSAATGPGVAYRVERHSVGTATWQLVAAATTATQVTDAAGAAGDTYRVTALTRWDTPVAQAEAVRPGCAAEVAVHPSPWRGGPLALRAAAGAGASGDLALWAYDATGRRRGPVWTAPPGVTAGAWGLPEVQVRQWLAPGVWTLALTAGARRVAAARLVCLR